MNETGKPFSISFDPGGLTLEDVARLSADIWADLPFNRDALAALKRDGLVLDGVNLGGPYPYRAVADENGKVQVTAEGPDQAVLLDLWVMHFQREFRFRNLAA